MGFDLCIAGLELVLNRDSTLHGSNRSAKLSQHIIARRIDHPAVMFLNEGGYDFAIGANRRFFIVAHEATVAGDISAEDSCEFALRTSALRC